MSVKPARTSLLPDQTDAACALILPYPIYFASGSGRIWKCITLLVVPLPVSMWNGARVLTVA